MAVFVGGRVKRSAGIIGIISKQVKILNLKPVKKIQVQFDPFHENAVTIRYPISHVPLQPQNAQPNHVLINLAFRMIAQADFLFHVSNPKVQDTNINCTLKTNIVCDRSDPEIKVDLGPEGSIKFLAKNLSVLEILQLLNKHLQPLIPVEEPPSNILTAKIQQKVQKRR